MNWIKKIVNGEIKIIGKSDRLIAWNTEHYHCWEKFKKRGFDFQYEDKKYDPETERLWIYVNKPKEKLLYIAKITEFKDKVPENFWEDCDKCREFNNGYNKFTYKLELLHAFEKGNNLQELQKYRHEKTKKFLFVPQPTRSHVYVSSYPELIKDIITGKIL